MAEVVPLEQAVGRQYYSPTEKTQFNPAREIRWDDLSEVEKRVAKLISQGAFGEASDLVPVEVTNPNYDPEKVFSLLLASESSISMLFGNLYVRSALRR